MPEDRTAEAARRAAAEAEQGARDPEPTLAKRFGQIGVLGWVIVAPTLAGMFLGRFIDRVFHSGITMTAALLMAGAVLGLWLAYRWMHEQ